MKMSRLIWGARLLGATTGLAAGMSAAALFRSEPVRLEESSGQTPATTHHHVHTQEIFPLKEVASPTAVVETSPAAAGAPEQENPSTEVKRRKIKLFTGNSNTQLAQEIAKELGCEMGKATVSRFEDGEVNVVVHDNVRGQDVYIIQSTCTPVNENLMELMLMVSTMRRASARRITAVIPYYGYARQDRKMTARVPISAADVARLLEAMGVDRVIAVDLHCGQIQHPARPGDCQGARVRNGKGDRVAV